MFEILTVGTKLKFLRILHSIDMSSNEYVVRDLTLSCIPKKFSKTSFPFVRKCFLLWKYQEGHFSSQHSGPSRSHAVVSPEGQTFRQAATNCTAASCCFSAAPLPGGRLRRSGAYFLSLPSCAKTLGKVERRK